MAILVPVPEGVGTIEAALANQVQRLMNILSASVLATLAMTIPAVIIVSMVDHTTLKLGLSPSDQVMLVLFLAYLLLIFIP